jgi:hypothetical protein
MDGYQCRTRGLPSIVIRTGPVIEPVKSWVQWFISPTIMNRLNCRFINIGPFNRTVRENCEPVHIYS